MHTSAVNDWIKLTNDWKSFEKSSWAAAHKAYYNDPFKISFLSDKLYFNFQDNFSSVWISFVKIVVMMVGEMDYSDLLSSNVVNSAKVTGTEILYVPLPVLSYIMFMLFVLSVSIILMNLLVRKIAIARRL